MSLGRSQDPEPLGATQANPLGFHRPLDAADIITTNHNHWFAGKSLDKGVSHLVNARLEFLPDQFHLLQDPEGPFILLLPKKLAPSKWRPGIYMLSG